ncbi:MAG: GAF domain-containing protein [Bacteroidota bacterium]
MSSSANSKNLSYYFRINTNTIQGRITVGFAVTALLAFVMIMISNLQWKTTLDTANYTRTVTAPAQLYALQLLKGTDNSLTAWECQHIDEKPLCAAKNEAIWKEKITPAMDSLSKLSKDMTTEQGNALIYSLRNSLEQLKTKQYKDISTAEAENYLHTEIEPLLLEINKVANQFQQLQWTQAVQAQASIAATNARLPYLLALGFIICCGAGGTLGGIIVTSVLARIRFLKYKLRDLGHGNLPDTIPPSKDELNAIITAINELTDNLRQVQHFADQVGKGNFDGNIKVFNDEGDLGVALSKMRDELKNVAEEDTRRNWLNEGISLLGDILRRHGNDLPTLADEVIASLVKYLQANQGGFFIVNNAEESRPHLVLQACYAYSRKKFLEKEIALGQGLVGQTWQEEKTIYLSDIPKDYLRITSGLGDANARFLLIVPLKNNNEIAGVLELASFQDFLPHQIAFVEKIAESIASTIMNARIVEKTNHLLTQAQQMQLHEEEMRQNRKEY